jgi:hypothetical protein
VAADERGKITERRRLTRSQFERFWENRPPCRVLMEACGSAHHWGRWLMARGFDVTLLPAHSVTPYVQRNKTDERDAEGLLEAVRSPRVHPVATTCRWQRSGTATSTTQLGGRRSPSKCSRERRDHGESGPPAAGQKPITRVSLERTMQCVAARPSESSMMARGQKSSTIRGWIHDCSGTPRAEEPPPLLTYRGRSPYTLVRRRLAMQPRTTSPHQGSDGHALRASGRTAGLALRSRCHSRVVDGPWLEGEGLAP